jgi:uncharacterized membrane protein
MSKMDLKGKLNQGLARNEAQKFEAADRAMASGGLRPEFGLTPAPPEATGVSLGPADEKPAKPKKTSRAPMRNSRADVKKPVGESAIVKETFSLPPDESAQIDRVRMRAAALGAMLNRSEVVRLGVMAALKYLDDEQLLEAANAIPRIKTGRPAGG